MEFNDHLRTYYKLTPQDVEITSVKGYWRNKKPCPGGAQCVHGFRVALGPCRGGGELMLHFAEYDRDARGRFMRPYREWERQRSALAGVGSSNLVRSE